MRDLLPPLARSLVVRLRLRNTAAAYRRFFAPAFPYSLLDALAKRWTTRR